MGRKPLARANHGHARVHETDAHPNGESRLTSEPDTRPGLSIRSRDRAGIFGELPSPPFCGESIESTANRRWRNRNRTIFDALIVGFVDRIGIFHKPRVNEFYQKGCQEESSASTGGEMFSRDPAHGS